MLKASVIIAFYNNVKSLKMILTALNNQYDDNFDVVIADDGSNDENVNEVKSLSSNYLFDIHHVWHEDKGFRKNKILNQAIMKATNDYLIFIDGDCIPQDNFVSDHLSQSEPCTCLNGRRADLSPTVSDQIREKDHAEPNKLFKSYRSAILSDYLRGKGKNIEKGFRITQPTLSAFLNRKNKGLVGCNFSANKADLLSINGFDERYEAPGIGEDSDIDYRLRLAGVKVKNVFFMANQIHLYHVELPRSSVNEALFDKVRQEKIAYTPYGINKSE
ncbi:glycosyl transferase [Photobacterium proteolyticum]|uniref:Glycosyl transferase n=1 Tax=Photobacterium proteolyticum TaxID=1903952 RepID=A0A1Q9GUM8_9GAMM|nr:glycosyltransferase [Photobacterium proteolyticum]OLQ78868.1 glycosyl transferase [Photobacterium proteolyticum]